MPANSREQMTPREQHDRVEGLANMPWISRFTPTNIGFDRVLRPSGCAHRLHSEIGMLYDRACEVETEVAMPIEQVEKMVQGHEAVQGSTTASSAILVDGEVKGWPIERKSASLLSSRQSKNALTGPFTLVSQGDRDQDCSSDHLNEHWKTKFYSQDFEFLRAWKGPSLSPHTSSDSMQNDAHELNNVDVNQSLDGDTEGAYIYS